jgi:hypothetical protein
MTRNELLELLSRLRCAPVGRARLRAPHKPLLLLWLFGRFAASGSAVTAYADAEDPLSALINDYGPPVASAAAVHPVGFASAATSAPYAASIGTGPQVAWDARRRCGQRVPLHSLMAPVASRRRQTAADQLASRRQKHLPWCTGSPLSCLTQVAPGSSSARSSPPSRLPR